MLSTPLNIPKWLEENSHLLKPPINNYCVYNDDMTVMIVGGPNARTDYHINTTPEWFYQYRGTMLLKVVDSSSSSPFKDIYIKEGSMFLLPPNTPHNPVRFANTVGIVLEQPRPEGSVDTLRWYCAKEDCRQVVYEESFHCTDLGTQIKSAVEGFKGSDEKRKCKACGTLAESAPREGEIKDPNVA
ncbi:hypothetical protein QTJ16_002994 [Diplocarpon rosae]|uniref:3-hydroxyanthranilate 3,4-dioxygenase n=1 Tax=Diplocarpon rosae TaxID=946125 RepID=A0AAD9T3T2_9HELO|nr:hypothetical protein QTJ16_002994 [Diplocarpon rosae]PBP22869.1 3-hydroxyanthranilate 3,4-dioxygenase [Diplocarpon rosae]